jgi:hypothetical protein
MLAQVQNHAAPLFAAQSLLPRLGLESLKLKQLQVQMG